MKAIWPVGLVMLLVYSPRLFDWITRLTQTRTTRVEVEVTHRGRASKVELEVGPTDRPPAFVLAPVRSHYVAGLTRVEFHAPGQTLPASDLIIHDHSKSVCVVRLSSSKTKQPVHRVENGSCTVTKLTVAPKASEETL